MAAYEIFERMASYGISSNLVIFLTNKLHQDIVSSANNMTKWVGTTWLTPIIRAYIADAHLGRYKTLIVVSTVYLSVMIVKQLFLNRFKQIISHKNLDYV